MKFDLNLSTQPVGDGVNVVSLYTIIMTSLFQLGNFRSVTSSPMVCYSSLEVWVIKTINGDE